MTATLERSLSQRIQPTPPRGRPGPDRIPRGSCQRTAVLVLVAAIFFQPILRPAGPGNSSPVDIFTILTIVTAAIWVVSGCRRARAPYVIPVLLILVGGAASGLAGLLPTTSLLNLVVDILLLAWCVAVANVVSAPRAMRLVLAAWSWAGIFWAAVVIVAWLGHITALEGLNAADGNRVLFTFGDPNYAGTYWDTAIFVVYAAQTPRRRWLRIAGYLTLVWALALTESNGGVLALCIGLVFLLLLRIYRRRGHAAAAAAGLTIALLAGCFLVVFPLQSIRQWAATSNQPLLANSIGRSAQSSSERTQLTTESLQLYQRSYGIVGLGPGSTKPLLTRWLYPYANEAHDDWLAALAEDGVIGLLGVLLLFSSAAVRAGPILVRPLSARFATAVPIPAGIVAALLALAVNSGYEEILHFRYLWALFGIVAVLGRDARR